MTATLTASLEDYLEAISQIIGEKQAVRPKDIARRLKVSNSSVTGALRALAERRLINYAPYDVISLTPAGRTAAREVVRRHETLRDFFVKVLAVDPTDADQAACQMEHSIPKVILERFIQFAEFVEVCPRGGSKWIAGFRHQCDHGGAEENCERCLELTLAEVRAHSQQGDQATMDTARLKDLKPGAKARVVRTTAEGEASRRIAEMGVTPGAVLEVERVAPLGDPIEIRVRGYHLSLRRDEAAAIEIETL